MIEDRNAYQNMILNQFGRESEEKGDHSSFLPTPENEPILPTMSLMPAKSDPFKQSV